MRATLRVGLAAMAAAMSCLSAFAGPAAPPMKSVSTLTDGAAGAAQGVWRGTAQFRYLSGAPLDARDDGTLVLDLRPDGRVQGGSQATGCRLEGFHSIDGAGPAALIEIEVTACRDARFNARYLGRLDNPKSGRSRLRLHAITAAMPTATPDGMLELSLATIDASLMR